MSFHPHSVTVISRLQLDAQIRAAVGVSLAQVEKPITSSLPKWTRENVDLIVTIPDRYFKRLERDVVRGIDEGQHPKTFAKQIEADFGSSESDAARIARDQIGKLNADFNQERQRSLGITSYIWRTGNDNRVRDNHFELEGTHHEWGDPPMGGGTNEDEAGDPGEGIQCRCYSEPDFDVLIASLG